MQDRVGLVQVGGELAQRLRHEAGLQAHVAVAHVALDLGAGREGGDRVDHDDVDGAGAHEHVADLERLLSRVGLGDEQLVDVDADGLGVDRVHGVLGVDVGADAAGALRLGHHVHGEGGLARGLRAVDLRDPAAGQTADPEGEVEGEGAGGHRADDHRALVPHLHDGALAELLLDAGEAELEGLLLVLVLFHLASPLRTFVSSWGMPSNLRRGCDRPGGCERQDCSYEQPFDQGPCPAELCRSGAVCPEPRPPNRPRTRRHSALGWLALFGS